MFTLTSKYEKKLGCSTVGNVIELSSRLGFAPKKIAEVGVGHATQTMCHRWIVTGATVVMFEPVLDFYRSIVATYGKYKNVTAYNFGVYDKAGLFDFADKLQSSYISELEMAPEIMNKYHWQRTNTFACQCVRFEDYDPGDFDMALIDTEGCEWFVVSQLKSRPRIISVEMGAEVGGYKNKYWDEIKDWMLNAGYDEIANDNSDIIYIRKV